MSVSPQKAQSEDAAQFFPKAGVVNPGLFLFLFQATSVCQLTPDLTFRVLFPT